MDRSEEIMMKIFDLQSQIQELRLSAESGGENSFIQNYPIIFPKELDWSYKVSVVEQLKIRISPGSRRVIHKSVDSDGAAIHTLSANTSTQIYAAYTYATEGSSASWSGPPGPGTPPGESALVRVFLIATIVTHEDGVHSITHHHCGDLEVYDLVEC